ncbi:hypothetical protein BMETH_1961_1 [methanotrophic bacterial endosymbiont of Bathymodiolus sp.]|nr:hypothetical protein BMETH_1961_1 [methanotrophic bacterial endosymbiont of Bathymodiolus sp.]
MIYRLWCRIELLITVINYSIYVACTAECQVFWVIRF